MIGIMIGIKKCVHVFLIHYHFFLFAIIYIKYFYKISHETYLNYYILNLYLLS